MRNKVIYLSILITIVSIFAENRFKVSYKLNCIDDILNTTEGEEKFDALMNYAGFYLTKSGDTQKGIAYLLQARDLALDINFTDGIIRSYESLGDIYLASQNYSVALDYFTKRAELLEKSENRTPYISALLKISDVCINAKNFDKSLTFLEKARFEAEKTGENELLTRIYYYLGLAYRGKFDYKKALDYNHMALELAEKEKTSWFEGNCYNAIGDLNEMLGNYDIAFENYKKAAVIYKDFNISTGLSVVYYNLASMHKVNGEYDKALDYLNKSLDISENLRYTDMIKENYMGLYGLYNLMKDFKNANKYYMLLNSFSTQNDSLNAPVSKIEIDYEISKKEMDKQLFNLKLEQERNIRYIYAAAFIILFAATYFHFYRKLKQKKINELRLEERRVRAELSSLQFKINPHFLFNSLSSISELINFDQESARKMLQNISNLLRYTLRTAKNEFVHLDEEIIMVRKYLEIEKIRFGKRLDFNIDIPETLSNMLIPPLLIQPLVENSIKLGLSNRLEGGFISISAYEKIPGRVTIIVEDNGVSKEGESKPEGNGIGLSSVKDRLNLVYGNDQSFKIEKDNGFKVILSLPKKL